VPDRRSAARPGDRKIVAQAGKDIRAVGAFDGPNALQALILQRTE
jgi:hypothetical protein